MATSIFSVFSAISGTLISANGIALACGNAKNIGTYLTIALGVILILISIFRKLVKKLFIYPLFKLLSVLACIALVVGIISSVALCIYGNADTATYEEDYLIVLGCGLNGSTPSESLVKRLDKAIEYSSRNTDCKIIVTGGQGSGEDVSEAEAMYIYLVENGINPERIIREDASTSTTENFEFSNNITNVELKTKTSVFITNDFHIYRAHSLAKLQGLSPNHLSASTPWHSVIPAYLRENLALVKMFVFKE